MFEKASKLKLRYKLSNGVVSTEDLWDFPLENLNQLAKSLNRELKQDEEESFIETKSSKSELIELRFEIVKHVIKVKLEEKQELQDSIAKQQRKKQLLEILESKQSEELRSMSKEDLLKELDSL